MRARVLPVQLFIWIALQIRFVGCTDYAVALPDGRAWRALGNYAVALNRGVASNFTVVLRDSDGTYGRNRRPFRLQPTATTGRFVVGWWYTWSTLPEDKFVTIESPGGQPDGQFVWRFEPSSDGRFAFFNTALNMWIRYDAPVDELTLTTVRSAATYWKVTPYPDPILVAYNDNPPGSPVVDVGPHGMLPWYRNPTFYGMFPVARWIWATLNANDGAPTNVYYNFTGLFELATPTTASIHVIVDNTATIFINGVAFPTKAVGGWGANTNYPRFNASLVAGRNSLVISAMNQGGPAGLLVGVRHSANGAVLAQSDALWKFVKW